MGSRTSTSIPSSFGFSARLGSGNAARRGRLHGALDLSRTGGGDFYSRAVRTKVLLFLALVLVLTPTSARAQPAPGTESGTQAPEQPLSTSGTDITPSSPSSAPLVPTPSPTGAPGGTAAEIASIRDLETRLAQDE